MLLRVEGEADECERDEQDDGEGRARGDGRDRGQGCPVDVHGMGLLLVRRRCRR